jgi:hypothetical protein
MLTDDALRDAWPQQRDRHAADLPFTSLLEEMCLEADAIVGSQGA